MSLQTRLTALSTRVATEFKSVRTALNGKASTVHSHAASDVTSGILDNLRLPERLRDLQTTLTADLNSANTSGWWVSTLEPANAPIAGAYTWGVEVSGFYSGYLVQTATLLLYGNSSNQLRYRRIMSAGVWSGWFSVEDSPVALGTYFSQVNHTHPPITTIPSTSQSGTAYTLALADAGSVVETTAATTVTVTVPTDANVAFPVGTVLYLHQQGAGQLVVAPQSGVTLRYPSSLTSRVRYATLMLRKRAANEWVVSGDAT